MQMINEINNNIMDEIISLINRNYFHNVNNLSLSDEKKQKELTYLQRKREEDNILRIKNDFIFQKEMNFSISSSKEKIENIKQKNELRNDSQLYLLNLGVNSCKKTFGESLDIQNTKESNKIDINIDKMKTNLINKNSINNNSLTKKILKNKKAVYIDRYFLNTNSTSRDIKKLKQNNKWQVLIMINNKKSYIGSYLSKELAARVYDILSIKNRGIKAKTNFIYNNIQKNNIIENKINIKSDNISDIIKKLIN